MNINSILLYEQDNVNGLYPFSILHCSWEVRCGALKIYEKIQNRFPSAKMLFQGRENHLNSFFARFALPNHPIEKENLFILNSIILPDNKFWDSIQKSYEEFRKEQGTEKSVIFHHRNTPLAAYILGSDMINPINFDKEFLPKLINSHQELFPSIEIPEPKLLNFLWDAIEHNSNSIIEDTSFYKNYAEYGELKKNGVHLINENSILIGKNCKIAPTVVLDADEGPIIIGNNVKIMPHSTILGPCFIGDNSIIKIGAKIYEHTAIGEWCKVGGEVENSIIHAYSNKQHEGFLGHSYISEWVNLGADTNTSDLKNTYSNIRVQIENEEFNTGKMFLGLLCGDHTKSAINTQFTTGTICGISSILFDSGFLTRFIQSFTWGGSKNSKLYVDKAAIDVAKKVMARRNKSLLPEEEKLIKLEFERVKSWFQ